MCCKKLYAELFAAHPAFRMDFYGTAHAISRCLYEMLYITRIFTPGMVGWYFAREWHCRHGFPLSRGTCFFIVRLPRARNMFVINDGGLAETDPYRNDNNNSNIVSEDDKTDTSNNDFIGNHNSLNSYNYNTNNNSKRRLRSALNEREALEWFRDNIMNHWPYVEIRAHCMYKSKRHNDIVIELQTRMASLLTTYFAKPAKV
jgi:hypothetical protein